MTPASNENQASSINIEKERKQHGEEKRSMTWRRKL